MTLATQRRWLRTEQRRCQQWLAEGHRSGHGASVLAKARADLAVLTALLETLEGRQLALGLEETYGNEVRPEPPSGTALEKEEGAAPKGTPGAVARHTDLNG